MLRLPKLKESDMIKNKHKIISAVLAAVAVMSAAPYFVKSRFPLTGETPGLSQPKPKNEGCS